VDIEISSPLGVVCHDAGGTNQILAMLRKSGFREVCGYFEGPARELWRKVGAPCELVEDLPQLFSRVHTLITSTGWGSRLEHDARYEAQRRGIRSIAVLDHWVNYHERFVREGILVLPNEIWVVDKYALEIARQTFPGLPIVLKPDRYAEQEVERITPLCRVTCNELCYLLEPARSNWGRDEAGEFQALRYFLDRLPHLQLSVDTKICLKPHPSDASAKYDAFLGEWHGYRVVLDGGDLAGSLSRARWVAGCQTYALTLALRTGRTVYCSLPPWAPLCQLPHSGLIHLGQVGRS
jgi:hypothetical protein